MDLATLIPIGAIIVGLAGVVYQALRFNREEAGKTVEQATSISAMYRDLIDELQDELARCGAERLRLEGHCDGLKAQLTEAHIHAEKLEAERRAVSVRLEQCTDREESLQAALRRAKFQVNQDE